MTLDDFSAFNHILTIENIDEGDLLMQLGFPKPYIWHPNTKCRGKVSLVVLPKGHADIDPYQRLGSLTHVASTVTTWSELFL